MMPLIAPPPFYLYFFNIDFFSMYTTFCNFLCITEWHIYNKYNQTVVSIHTGFLTYMYDPDSSPSLSYIWSWFFPFMHCLIYDPDSSPSLLYMTKNNWNLSFIHYFFILPFIFYIVWQFSPYGEESGYSLNSWWEKKKLFTTFYFILYNNATFVYCLLLPINQWYRFHLNWTNQTSDWTNTTNSRIFCLLCIWNVFTYRTH